MSCITLILAIALLAGCGQTVPSQSAQQLSAKGCMGTTATGTAQVVGIESAPSGSPFQTLDFSLTLDGTFGASQYFHYSFANVCLADQSLSQGSRLEVQVWQQSTSGTTAFPNSQISSGGTNCPQSYYTFPDLNSVACQQH